MKRGLLILILGLAGAVVAYCCVYLAETATPRALMRSDQPELAWLKHEFQLTDTEFKRISELHTAYLPQCRERCRLIDELNGKLSALLAKESRVTPEVDKLLQDRALLRARCQVEMLEQLYRVSNTMPPAQGKRYLAWAQNHTCLRDQGMVHDSAAIDGTAPALPQH